MFYSVSKGFSAELVEKCSKSLCFMSYSGPKGTPGGGLNEAARNAASHAGYSDDSSDRSNATPDGAYNPDGKYGIDVVTPNSEEFSPGDIDPISNEKLTASDLNDRGGRIGGAFDNLSETTWRSAGPIPVSVTVNFRNIFGDYITRHVNKIFDSDDPFIGLTDKYKSEYVDSGEQQKAIDDFLASVNSDYQTKSRKQGRGGFPPPSTKQDVLDLNLNQSELESALRELSHFDRENLINDLLNDPNIPDEYKDYEVGRSAFSVRAFPPQAGYENKMPTEYTDEDFAELIANNVHKVGVKKNKWGNPIVDPAKEKAKEQAKKTKDSIFGTKKQPIVLDLDGDGLELVNPYYSSVYFDHDNDGYRERIGWVAPDDGFLVTDLDLDNQVNTAEELIVANQTDEEDTDLEALASLYDSNGDGILNAQDDNWEKLKIWRDLNQNGVSDSGELNTLEYHGIESIDLQITKSIDGEKEVAGNEVTGTASYTRIDGTSSEVGDVSLTSTEQGYKVVENQNGVQTIEFEDGSQSVYIAGENEGIALQVSSEAYGSVSGSKLQDSIEIIGNDDVVVHGLEGNDYISTGDGNDQITGGQGDDTLIAGGGNDVLFVDAEDSYVNGGEGYDAVIAVGDKGLTLNLADSNIESVQGSSGNDFLDASSYNIEGVEGNVHGVDLVGKDGDDTLIGSAYDDMIVAGAGHDTVMGNDGDDTLVVNDGDVFNGGAGQDRVFYNGSTDLDLNITNTEVEIFFSGDGDDIISTDMEKAAALYGRKGDDTLSGGWGGTSCLVDRAMTPCAVAMEKISIVFGIGDGHDVIEDEYVHTGQAKKWVIASWRDRPEYG